MRQAKREDAAATPDLSGGQRRIPVGSRIRAGRQPRRVRERRPVAKYGLELECSNERPDPDAVTPTLGFRLKSCAPAERRPRMRSGQSVRVRFACRASAAGATPATELTKKTAALRWCWTGRVDRSGSLSVKDRLAHLPFTSGSCGPWPSETRKARGSRIVYSYRLFIDTGRVRT